MASKKKRQWEWSSAVCPKSRIPALVVRCRQDEHRNFLGRQISRTATRPFLVVQGEVDFDSRGFAVGAVEAFQSPALGHYGANNDSRQWEASTTYRTRMPGLKPITYHEPRYQLCLPPGAFRHPFVNPEVVQRACEESPSSVSCDDYKHHGDELAQPKYMGLPTGATGLGDTGLMIHDAFGEAPSESPRRASEVLSQ